LLAWDVSVYLINFHIGLYKNNYFSYRTSNYIRLVNRLCDVFLFVPHICFKMDSFAQIQENTLQVNKIPALVLGRDYMNS